jgi:methylated-DNA-protein-cysteine methyltransferase-like protein
MSGMTPTVDAVRDSIMDVIARIPSGKVTTYGAVARQAGWPRHSRLVGRVLSALPQGSALPWHRVLASGGRIALPEGSRARCEQLERLGEEGVDVTGGRVNLRNYGWKASAEDLDRWLWRPGDEN